MQKIKQILMWEVLPAIALNKCVLIVYDLPMIHGCPC